MNSLAHASTLILMTAALASPSLAQTSSRSRPVERVAVEPQESDRGTVISVTPIVQQVAVPQRMCQDEPVAVQRQPSGAGALIGAIAGGAMGNAIGAGAGRAAATALGVFGGAVIGNNIEADGQGTQMQSVRRCTTHSAYEERTVAYSVVYEYAGRQYTTQMRQDPGRTVQVQVQAAPEGEVARPSYAPPQYAAPVRPRYAPPVYSQQPVYPAYAEPVYESYPPPAPVYYEPGYPQFGAGLVVGALIGYGVHRGYYRHDGPRWRGGRGY